jgi:hypothetical protein
MKTVFARPPQGKFLPARRKESGPQLGESALDTFGRFFMVLSYSVHYECAYENPG